MFFLILQNLFVLQQLLSICPEKHIPTLATSIGSLLAGSAGAGDGFEDSAVWPWPSRSRSSCIELDCSQCSGSSGNVSSVSPPKGNDSITRIGCAGPYSQEFQKVESIIFNIGCIFQFNLLFFDNVIIDWNDVFYWNQTETMEAFLSKIRDASGVATGRRICCKCGLLRSTWSAGPCLKIFNRPKWAPLAKKQRLGVVITNIGRYWGLLPIYNFNLTIMNFKVLWKSGFWIVFVSQRQVQLAE